MFWHQNRYLTSSHIIIGRADWKTSNYVSTTKYNIITFIPVFLFYQFKTFGNWFFLMICIVQFFPNLNPYGTNTTIVPLVIIILAAAAKEIFEDFLKVGQVVKIMKNEFIPADIVLLSSSEPAGVAYIETSNLDGETNLKIRQALPQTAQIIDDDDRIMAFCSSLSKIECDPPNPALYEFHGVIKINNSSEVLKKGNDENSKTNCSLGTNQLLPRGCKLQNTDWVCGVTVYTGRCTKLVLNTSGNFRRLHILPTLVGLIIFYSGLIPISLNITLEMIQLFQAYFIQQDLNLYDKNSDIKAEVRSSNLNSQLGQVRYIISDKTGTLTQNKMRFKMCTIGGIKYGSMMTEKFTDEAILDDLINNAGNAKSIRDFLTLLAICHMVVPEKVINSELEKIIYHSPSPDEKALVKGAKDLKFIFHTRTPQCVYIEAMGKQEKYDILHILEFTSNRKRMGVIVRCPDRKLKLYIKGADSVIFPRLALNSDKYSVNKTAEHLNLELLGASAIEDKLQKDVKKTIEHLIEGGIIVWVLTGDKLETAQSIGYSCGLIDPFTPILVLGERNAEETANKINIYLENFANKKIKTSLIVSGEASVVKALKNWSDGTVLAIGDGANDVAMIQEADIGVGISGEEGLQASLAADYSIAQFFYEFHTLFADSAIMDSWSLVMFNIFFTSWPPLAIGIWDRLFPFEVMIDYPALYHLSQSSEGFSLKAYFIWAFTGLVHATVISLIAYQTFKNDVIWYNGRVANYYVMGTAVVLIVNLKAIIETDSITIMSWIALFGSIIMLFIFFFSYSLTSPASPIIKVQPAMADTILHVLTSPVTYSYIIFVTSVSLSFDLIVKLLQRSLYRTIRDEVVSREFDVKQFNDLYYPLVKVKQIVTKASESALSLVNIQTKQRGYSFAQEDEPAISQSDVVRLYDSRMPKISKNR
uniref:Bm9322 n=1 Tax=Brugia malayi TaxID=6279 RepID=A0A0H5S5Z8_BRUMA|nr:Bm9322 [Brugia malayi]